MNNQGGNNNASNPFQLFVLDFKDKQEKRGIFYRSQSEATDAAQPYWTQLSQREKQEYTQKANFPKRASNVSTCSSKLTSQGIPLEEMERRKQEEIRKRKEMEQKIEKTLRDAYEDQTLVDLQFNIFATTDFCQTLTGDIFAAELAMAKFSLRSGVVDSIHMQINPGKLPLGFRASAQEKSDSTHKLKIPPEASGESNYFRIYKTITKFIANGGSKNFPYIFTHNEILNTARLTIRKILEETEAVDDIQVYSIEEFFGPLKKYTMKIKQEGIPSQANKLVVRDVLDRDPYAYQMGIGCEFHDSVDQSIHCNLSQVKRWSFCIADYCLMDISYLKFIKGKHMPDDADLKLPESKMDEGNLIEFDEIVDSDSDTIVSESSYTRSRLDSFTNRTDLNSSFATRTDLNSSFTSITSSRFDVESAGERPSDDDFMSYATLSIPVVSSKWRKLGIS